MAGKEKRSSISRQINKETKAENEKNKPRLTLAGKPKQKPGPKPKVVKSPVEPTKKRVPRRTKADASTAASTPTQSEDPKSGAPKGRKPFLEKELEDILENATGRNTHLDSRPGFFLPKSRREPEDDTLSVRSLTTFLRTSKRTSDREPEDDVLSLRSVKLRKDDEDSMSVRSLPGKPGKKTKKVLVQTQKKVTKPQKDRAGKTPATKATRLKAQKTKEKKELNKNIKQRLQNKIVAKRRSNMLLTKKVRNAKNAVKRIIKKKAEKEKTALVKEKPGPSESRPDSTVAQVKPFAPALIQPNGDGEVPPQVGNETIISPPSKVQNAPAPRRKLIRGTQKEDGSSSTPSSPGNSNATTTRKRRWTSSILFESAQSPDDSSVIIVQPRLGPKLRRDSNKTSPNPTLLTGRGRKSSAVKTVEKAAVAAAPIASEPIVQEPEVKPKDEGSSSTKSTPTSTPYFIQTVPSLNALMSQPTARGDWLVTPTGVVLIQAVPQPSATPDATVATNVAASIPSEPPASSKEEPAAGVPSPQPSPLSLSAVSPMPPTPTPVVVTAVATPCPSSPAGVDSMLSEKAREAEPAQEIVMPTIPVAKNELDMLELKVKMDEEPETPCDTKADDELWKSPSKHCGSGRRASHDGSFGPVPQRIERRTGSCDRLDAPSPRPILQLGSEPLQLADVLRPLETVSSYSLNSSLSVPSPLLKSEIPTTSEPTDDSDVADVPVQTDDADLADVPVPTDDSDLAVAPVFTDNADGSEVPVQTDDTDLTDIPAQTDDADLTDVPVPTDDSDLAVAPVFTDNAVGSEVPVQTDDTDLPDVPVQTDDSDLADVPVFTDNADGTDVPVSTEEVPPPPEKVEEETITVDAMLSTEEEDDKVNLSNDVKCTETVKTMPRTKKYARSLDSRQKLVPEMRRRSHPEPTVINIVTSEDGSKRGLALVEELRQRVTPAEPEPPLQVPYLDIDDSLSQSTAPAEEPSEEQRNKETMLSALGLRSLKVAAELAQRKREQPAPPPSLLALTNIPSTYTGTLKTVIKIQRPEKKGNGRMIYKASSSSTPVLPNNFMENNNGPEVEDTQQNDPSPNSKESHESGDEEGKNGGQGKAKALVIPEKASSFSIHPHRMCSDVCTYCFGKFGLLDTPCHIAQLKDSEKRRNILDIETHLTLESCLCDACFRHVDKKSNGPPMTEKKPGKRKLMVPKQIRCSVENCDLDAMHNVRRKSILKLKKSLGKKLTLDQAKLDKLQPAHLVTLCNRHIYWVDYFMSCGLCNKRLAGVHMHRVGSEVLDVNNILKVDGIPTVLTEKRFLCKMCHYYCSIRLKTKDPSEMSSNQRQFYESFRKRMLQSQGIEVPDSETEADDPDKTMKTKTTKKIKPSTSVTNGVTEHETRDETQNAKHSAKASTSSSEQLSDLRAKIQTLPHVEGDFYRCNTTIQFTKSTKDLFYNLQRPYGNYSSFIRHLVMLEKFFRSGDLVLSRNADPQTVKYINGVNNRLRSFDGVPQVSSRPFTLTPVHAASTSSASGSSCSTPSCQSSASATTSSTPISKTTSSPPPNMPPLNPLTQLQSAVHNIGIKPDISISSVGSEPRKLTPKIQENLRALANRASKPSTSNSGQTRAVILNRTVGGQKQSLVQVTTGGKTIHLTLAQFRRIQQMQLKKKQYLEMQTKSGKSSKKLNGPSTSESVDFPNIPKALSVSVTKVPAVDLTQSPPNHD